MIKIPKSIADIKRGKEGEFFINLFEWCNMRCSFCWQDHSKWDGIESIVSRSTDIYDYMNKDSRDYFSVNLMGGELFADEIPESIFEDYLKLVKEIHKNTSKKFEVNWVTNLVYENIERVRNLVNEVKKLGIKTTIATSFDFAGRFNIHQKKLFEKNVYLLKDLIGTVSVVLTKPNIEKFTSKKDDLFEKMYKDNFLFYFDYYSPEDSYSLNAPSDALIQKGLLYLVDNYPEIYPIKDWINKTENEMSCRGSVVIDHTGVKGQCRSLLTSFTSNLMNSEVVIKNNTSMEETFVNKYDCISCSFFKRCGMGCFLQHDFKGREELSECLYKGVFREILKKEKS